MSTVASTLNLEQFMVTFPDHITNDDLATRIVPTFNLIDFMMDKLTPKQLVEFVSLLIDLPDDDFVWFENSSFKMIITTVRSNNIFIC